MLKRATARMALTGTLTDGFMRERLDRCQWCFSRAVDQLRTHSFEHGAPPSLAIAHRRRLPDVTHPIVPFTKQIASAQLMTVPAARLLVAWMINSISGLPVRVVRMASGLGMQKSKTRIIVMPLLQWDRIG